MPIITKYRTWCKTCGEWELHSSTMINNEEEWVCDKCGELHELYKFSEIEKKRKELEEKRKLYEEKFKGVNRNDDCPCGKLNSNGKPFKYKKCCLSKFNYI